ncbi:T9SS type A sorting domain-containing protein [Flavobacterium sp. RHBU_3]|uniref:T9SS type A sorting domain-containing protein n=1 Tax=Flavobacterium sp. RHBU_3 TaxID=3391184 RepID=UPI003984C69F
MNKFLLAAGLLGAVLNMNAQCETAATSLSEDFTNFTIGTSNVFPQNCWSSIALGYPNGGMVYTAQAGDPANQYAVFYASTAVNVNSYLITPEIATIDGTHQLSFSTWKLAQNGTVPAGTVTIQVGTITDTADADTFVAVGDAITVTTGTAATFGNMIIPATTGAHIAFRISADTVHNAIAIDDVVWEEVPAEECAAVTELNEDFSTFTTGQTESIAQNCWSGIANGMYIYPDTDSQNNASAVFYSFMSPNTAAYLVSPAVSNLDGNHTLTFDASAIAAITLQPGYLTNATDATTFVAVGDVITLGTTTATYSIAYPEVAGIANIAFLFTAPGVHQVAYVDNVVWAETPDACPAVSSINENFDNYATGQAEVITQYCWTAISNGMYVYPATVSGSPAAQFYSFMSPGVAAYLVSPEVDSFDGNHTLTFDASSSTAVALQPGYLTNPADASTFVAVGDEITLAAAPATTYTVSSFPALEANAYIAFRFVAAGSHNTASVDNIIWETTAGTDNLQKNNFTLYPNPVTNGIVNIANTSGNEGLVNVYNLTGAKVHQAKAATGNQQLNLSHLGAGMYIIQFSTGNYVTSQKLIIQ